MSREARAIATAIEREKAGELPASEKLVPQSNAGDCQCCKAFRQMRGIQNRTVIYCKRGAVRFCKCLVCLSTWKIAGMV